MAKITLDNITSGHASTTLFNTNFTAIEDELNDKVLYRNNPLGEANQMMNALDMNSNDILNTGVVNTTSLVLNGQTVAADAVAAQEALNVNYDNATSGLTAVNVQDAIDEVAIQTEVVTLDNTFDSLCTVRVNRVGNMVTIAPDTDWGSATPIASSYQTNTGVIPTWARPATTIINTCWTSSNTFAHLEIRANGILKVTNINVAGIGTNIDTNLLDVVNIGYSVEV